MVPSVADADAPNPFDAIVAQAVATPPVPVSANPFDAVVKGALDGTASAGANPTASPPPTPSHHQPTQWQRAVMPTPAAVPEPAWGDVASQAVHNLPSSAAGIAGAIGNTIMHPIKTAENIGQLGSGLVSQAAGALGVQQDPAAKAKTEALASALEHHYATAYGSVPGFKRAVGTDPLGVALDASTVLGGAGAAADVAGLGRVGGVLGKLGSAVDPVANAARVASLPIRALSNPVTRTMQSVTTGVPESLLSVAKAAGATTDPTLRAAFMQHFTGHGDPVEFMQTAQNALRAVKQDSSDAYLAGKAGLATAPVDFTNTYKALSSAADDLSKGASSGFPRAKQAINDVANMVGDVAQNPDPAARNIVNADALKRQIYDLHTMYSNPTASQFIDKVYRGVKADMTALDPKYSALMEQYQTGLANITNVTKTLGLGGKSPAASAALMKSLKAMKTPSGASVFGQLAKKEPTLPYALAGSALSPWSANAAHNVLGAILELPWAGLATHGNLPLGVAGMAGQAAATSPRLAGMLNYGAGAAGRALPDAAASPALRGSYYAGRMNEEKDNTSGATAPTPSTPNTSDADAATRMLIAEAGNQPEEGKVAALYTAINRAKASGKSVSEEIHAPNAYEGVTNGNAAGVDAGSPLYRQIHDNIVVPALAGQIEDPTGGMTHFLNRDLQAKLGRKIPRWASGDGKQIGDHTFYRADGGRIQRASGGKVVDAHVERLVRRLMSAVEAAKVAEKRTTKPLLNIPDSAVAKALQVAQRAI